MKIRCQLFLLSAKKTKRPSVHLPLVDFLTQKSVWQMKKRENFKWNFSWTEKLPNFETAKMENVVFFLLFFLFNCWFMLYFMLSFTSFFVLFVNWVCCCFLVYKYILYNIYMYVIMCLSLGNNYYFCLFIY